MSKPTEADPISGPIETTARWLHSTALKYQELKKWSGLPGWPDLNNATREAYLFTAKALLTDPPQWLRKLLAAIPPAPSSAGGGPTSPVNGS